MAELSTGLTGTNNLTASGLAGLKDFKTTDGRAVRHCKIVGTLGPASSNEKTLRELIEAGLDIARLNFSHGTHEQHRANIDLVRRLARESGRQVSLLQDLQGPKIRTGKILGDKQEIITGKTYTLAYGIEQTVPEIIPIDHRELVHDVAVGQRVLMDDGLLSLLIERIEGSNVIVRVLEGGILKSRKGVNFPEAKLSLPALSEKDSRDLLFGISHGVDFVALSFVQRPEDVLQVKKMIQALGADIPVIAKIEKLPAIDEIDAICAVADGLMVARGDLGVEGSVERVPGFQKRIIAAAAKLAKPVIIATQMLESMIENPEPTLAELADVANGVLDGADCVMLSGEVASGKYPVECVRTMARLINEVEGWTFKRPVRYRTDFLERHDNKWEVHEAIARAACEAADELNAKAIVCLTLTGAIAMSVAKWRPHTPIIAISPRRDVVQRLVLVWGVYAMQNPLFYNTDVLLQDLPALLKSMGIVNSGDRVVITAGIPINQMKPTNMIKINRIP
ncbi:MAG: pyruvate kinase [Proteobacteria bacterium]|nr:pyruvate kinase [Pseudomonadota bacterium]